MSHIGTCIVCGASVTFLVLAVVGLLALVAFLPGDPPRGGGWPDGGGED